MKSSTPNLSIRINCSQTDKSMRTQHMVKWITHLKVKLLALSIHKYWQVTSNSKRTWIGHILDCSKVMECTFNYGYLLVLVQTEKTMGMNEIICPRVCGESLTPEPAKDKKNIKFNNICHHIKGGHVVYSIKSWVSFSSNLNCALL